MAIFSAAKLISAPAEMALLLNEGHGRHLGVQQSHTDKNSRIDAAYLESTSYIGKISNISAMRKGVMIRTNPVFGELGRGLEITPISPFQCS